MRRLALSAALIFAAAPADAAFRYLGGQDGTWTAPAIPLEVEAPAGEISPDMIPPGLEPAAQQPAAPAYVPAAPPLQINAPEPPPAAAAQPGLRLAEQPDPGETIEGFGSRVPLVVALQAILPKGYGFAYGAGVPIAQPVDWAGAKPWRILLSDVLAGLKLYGVENDRFVYIEKE